MEWYEWVATAATGGLYAVGKTVYQASQAAEQVGQQVSADVEKVADEAASALDKLFRSLNTSAFEIAQTIKNIDELFKLERPDGRADSELLPEELRRKNDLSAKLAWLQARAQDDQNILNNPGNLRPDRIVDIEADLADTNAKIELVEREIADIVYQEPGYIPETVRSLDQVVQRFNTEEQPRIEQVVDSVNQVVQRFNTEEQPRIEQVVDSVNQLFKLERPDGRADSELLPEELRRKNDLSAKLAWLQARTQDDQNILNNPGNLEPDRIVDIEADLADTNAKIELVEREIADIVYQEPGYIPETVRSLDQVVQRFNTEEQPRIEHLIESLDQTVLESKKTLQETQATIAQARTFLRLLQGLVTNRWVKIGAIVIVALFGLILLFGTIALFRVAFRV